MTCSPKTDPATMRVRQPQTGRRRTLGEEKAPHPRADSPHAAPGRGGAGRWNHAPGSRQGAWYQRGHLPSVEESLRWYADGLYEAPAGAGEGERSPQEDRCRSGSGHQHPKGGEPGKLLSPARRRAAVKHVRRKLEISERRACRVIGQPRATQRYRSRRTTEDWALLKEILALSAKNPRYGYRRVWALLRKEGFHVNKKRVHRLWREAGLRVPARQRKRRRLRAGGSEDGCTRMRAEYKGYLWSYDFVMDRPDDGCRLKMLLLVHEEHTREYLYIGVERSFTAQSVVKVLTTLFEERGEPALIRSDNGPEFIVRAVRRWLEVC